MKVNPGSNSYCAPAVLSILTGKNTDETAKELDRLLHIDGSKVTAVPVLVIIAAVHNLGGDTFRLNSSEGCSLFVTLYSIVDTPGRYLVITAKTKVLSHIIAVEIDDKKQVYMCDNRTKVQVKIEASIELSSRVLGVYRVEMPLPYDYTNSGKYAEILQLEGVM